MTLLQQYFIDTITMLDEIGADYFIHGSTLLGKVRNDCLLNRYMITNDKELNFGMLAKDFTPRVYYELVKRNKFFNSFGKRLPNALTYFSTFEEKTGDMWALPAFSLIALYWEGKTKQYEYMGSETVMGWDKELFDKDKWETIEFLGKKVKTPYKKEKWLSDYYGDDYMIENRNWHYEWAAHNREILLDVVEDEELIF